MGINNWLSKKGINWLLIDIIYDCQAKIQNIYDIFCVNTDIIVL